MSTGTTDTMVELLKNMRMPSAGMTAITINALITILLPVALCVWLGVKRKAPVSPIVIGASVFVVFALVLEQWALRLLLSAVPDIRFSTPLMVVISVMFAGIFEETGRFAAFHFLRRRDSARGRPVGVNTALAYGAGHGGIESMLLVGITSINNIATFALINSGQSELLLSALPEDQRSELAFMLIEAIQMPPVDFLAASVERILSMTLHICLSVLVWMAVSGVADGKPQSRKAILFYPMAIILHAGVNVTAAVYQAEIIDNVWFTEGILAVGVGCVLALTIYVYRRFTASAPVPLERVITAFTPQDKDSTDNEA